MTRRLLIGLDLGTTGARAVLIAEDGSIRHAREFPYPMHTPRPGWAEQDPEAWETAAFDALRAAAEAAAGDDIAALGLTGQMHGATLLDREDHPIRPAIIWCDARTGDARRAIEDAIGLATIMARTGNPPLEGFTAPKLLWVRDHEPQHYARIARVLLPKDFVRLRLTGESATDVSDASGTALFDVRRRVWSKAMLSDLEIPADWLPAVHESPNLAGRLSAAAAERCGLPAGLPVAAGASDQAAGGVAAGRVAPGDAVLTIGSSGVVFTATDVPHVDADGRVHTFCHARPETWHIMGVTQGAGLSLRWLRDVLTPDLGHRATRTGADAYDLITAEAAGSPPGSRGLIWLPYVQGERTPHLDPSARGVLAGISTAHNRADVLRAVLEGVAFSLRDAVEIIEGMGVPLQALKLAGGGARSALWRQVVADVLQRPLEIEPEDRGPAFGAALLAGVAVGSYDSVADACAATARPSPTVEPQPRHRAAYDAAYGVYRSLYPALRPSFRQLAAAP